MCDGFAIITLKNTITELSYAFKNKNNVIVDVRTRRWKKKLLTRLGGVIN